MGQRPLGANGPFRFAGPPATPVAMSPASLKGDERIRAMFYAIFCLASTPVAAHSLAPMA